jgi:2-oxoglutarate ferredoxin oxidoreductase subunit alpha
MQEGISYIAGARLPAVFVNVVRGGPGLGDIQPAQCDYFQATKGGGHGDYHLIVLAPSTLQEAVDLTGLAFDLADKYRAPSLVLADGMLGQMMEPVEFPQMRNLSELPDNSAWALRGAKDRKPNIVTSFDIAPENLERMNMELVDTYETVTKNETRCEEYRTNDAEYIIAAFGSMGRICKSVVDQVRNEGYKVGLLRPITLWPFPYKIFEKYSGVKFILDVEMSYKQFMEDVRLGVHDKIPVYYYGRLGGMVPTPTEVEKVLIEKIGRR